MCTCYSVYIVDSLTGRPSRTTARISPADLVPAGAGFERLPFEAKRVDYALYIEPTTAQAHQIRKRLEKIPNMSEWSINQTDAAYLKTMPHIASIELKRSRSSIAPLIQLAIWNSALFARLGRLCSTGADPSDMMPIPSLSVSGHRWEVYYTYIQGAADDDDNDDGYGNTRVSHANQS
jgi:hypothetical protein